MTSYLETVLRKRKRKTEMRVVGRRPSAPWELHWKNEMMGEVESGGRRAGAESRTGHLLCPEDSKKASGAGQSGESKGRDGWWDRQAACRQPSDGLHGRDRAPGSVRVQEGQSDVSLSGSFTLSAPQRTNCMLVVERGGVTQMETET